MMRFHGTTTRFPWEFEESADLAVVEAVRLRYRLLPYLHSAAVEAAQSGMPMMRPLPFHAPDEPGAWTADLEYLLGPDLLVAPMTNPEGERHVYLPRGEWVDHWTGEVHSGGCHLHVRKPLDQVPLFVRRNALIPLAAPPSPTSEHDIVLACWGSGDGESVVHTENGAAAIRLVRSGTHADVTVDGPLRVTGVTFPVVAGAVPPPPSTSTVTPSADGCPLGPETPGAREPPASNSSAASGRRDWSGAPRGRFCAWLRLRITRPKTVRPTGALAALTTLPRRPPGKAARISCPCRTTNSTTAARSRAVNGAKEQGGSRPPGGSTFD